MLDRPAKRKIHFQPANGEDSHGLESTSAAASVSQNKDARVVGERCDQLGVPFERGDWHNDETPW